MLGDILIIEEKHRVAAKQILQHLLDLQGDKILLAISGESGSGKSELAHLVARELKTLGTPAKILHIDNYYRIPPQDRTRWRQEQGFDKIGYTEYDWELINQNISEFLQDRKSQMPCIDLLTDQIDLLQTDFQGIKYLIIEGLYSIKAEAALRVFIDLTYHDTKNTQLVRGKEPQNEFRRNVLMREHEVVRSLLPMADLIVTKEFDVVLS